MRGFLAITAGSAALLSGSELRAEFTEVATLSRPTHLGGDGESFAQRSVACSGGNVLVGASSEDGITGAVYAFSGAGYADVARLAAPADETKKQYSLGASVAASGNTVIVGSSQIDGGYVRFFEKQGGVWTHQQIIEGSGDARFGSFGHRVAIFGDRAVVTAPKEAGDTGRIYVYRREAGVWTEEAALAASDGMMSDFLGLGFGLDRDTVIASAPTNPLLDTDRGATYVFSHSGGSWSQTARFDLAGQTPAPPAIYYGAAASIEGDWAVVAGTPGTDETLAYRVYVYQRTGTTWQQAQVIMLSAQGAAPLLQGGRLYIQSGSGLHVYTRSGDQWTELQALPPFASSTFAVCGRTLVRTNAPNVLVYEDPTLPAVDPTVSGGGPDGASGGGGAETKDEGGCSYRSVRGGATSPGLLATALLLIMGILRLNARSKRRG